MGTIVERKRKNGSTAYLAQISINRDGKRAHSESRTFDRRPAATAWLTKREKELEKTGALGLKQAESDPTLGKVIDRYITDNNKQIGRTKAQVLAAIKTYDIADMRCAQIGSKDIVRLAQDLSDGRQPQTVANYLSHLAAIFAIARPAWGIELDQQAMKDAHVVVKRLGLTRKSKSRDRRPSLDELDQLLSHFEEIRTRRPGSNPMAKIIVFALFSTRRQEEITRIAWADLDRDGLRVLVRDMKNPGEKLGNDVWVDLPPEAMRVIEAMPKTSKEIFPYSTDAISAAFTRACKFLEIEDLHFHDLRHEGVSRLFELGLSIPRVAAVSGHRSWSSLKGYAHLRQVGNKYEKWPWLEKITIGGL